MRNFIFTLIISGCTIPSWAQGADSQTRIVVHTTADLSPHWFVTNWTIGNVKAESPNNINIFPGIGYRGLNWWLEGTVQRQWSKPGNSWALDFRYSGTLTDRLSVYAESAPLLTHSGEYEFVFMDVLAWKQLAFGAETENVHKPGADSIGGGPRVSFPVASLGDFQLSLGATYQFRRGEADIRRLYAVLNRRVKH